MGVAMTNRKDLPSSPSSLDEGRFVKQSNNTKTGSRFRRRSHSMPLESNHEDVIVHRLKQETTQRKSGFRFARPKLRHQSRSLPVGSSSGSISEDRSLTKGKKRPRRKISFDFLRRSASRESSDGEGCGSNDSKESKGGSITEESDEDSVLGLSLLSRTRIVAESTSPINAGGGGNAMQEDDSEEHDIQATTAFSCATAILRHSYLENMCGVNPSLSEDGSCHHDLPDDPTVQESIECIFASQLEDGLELWDDDDEPEQFKHGIDDLISPAALQQSLQNRSDRNSSFLSQNKQRYQQASLVYVGTFDPTIPANEKSIDDDNDPLPCECAHRDLPSCRPEDWPQAPLLLRPSTGSGTRVKGIRMSGSKEFLWEPGSYLTWPEILAKKWGRTCDAKPRYACCEKCAILPINNGNEEIGKSLVIDFESDLFEGSLMLRLRYAEGTTQEPYDDNKGYFQGMNRRYQAVVRGRFKKSIPWTELVTGFQFNRPCGKLPPKWILRGGLKVVSFFAPQLDAKFEGSRPYSLTPLGSTPQSISVENQERDLIDGIREEPTAADHSLLGVCSVSTASLQRARARKKAFDKLFVQKSKDLKTDPSKIYTFEFLQHLFNFQDFSIELGSMLGSVELEEVLDGQPLQIMAAHGDQPIFSFDIWHECLWGKASQRSS